MSLPPELAFVFGETVNVFHRTRLISREMVAESTLALTIERPADFEFSAGQHTLVSIPGANADNLKEFTIASAPSDPDIVLATRVRNSKFKDALYALKAGDAITLRSASGTLWTESHAPQVWLSGGIGITPFRSILRELMQKNAQLNVTHIHSDRSRASVSFLAEFESCAIEHDGYRFIPTLTREKTVGGQGGRITRELIASHAPQFVKSDFFVVGTESFVSSMRAQILSLGVSASQIRTERFEGYKPKDA